MKHPFLLFLQKRWRLLTGGLFLILLTACLLFGWQIYQQTNFVGFTGDGDIANVTVPAGFEVTVFTSGLKGPRFMSIGPDGVLYVADRGNGRIVALPDSNQDGRADEIIPYADAIDNPHSLAYYDGHWYVGVPSGVIRLDDEDGDGFAESHVTIIDGLSGGAHSTRTVLFLPDGRLLLSAGSTCNVCVEENPHRAAVTIYDDATGTSEHPYAIGLRNAVGLTLQPGTSTVWASNNGRDLLGDDSPPETIYQLVDGGNYGWPYCHSGRIEDPDYGSPGSCEGVLPPAVEMQAHSAPLGLTFYDGQTFPADYQGSLFVAFHGSWNRTVPTGYKVVQIPFSNGQAGTPIDFATGWLSTDGATAVGRPTGLTVGSDGALYVSDDKGGIVYRVQYVGP